MDLGLHGKRVLITGSARGIGFSTAKSFLSEGAEVIINGRNEGNLNQAYRSLSEDYGDRIQAFRADVLSDNDLKAMYTFLEEHFGALDILISNVGSGKPESENQVSALECERFYRINTISAINVLQQLHPLLKKGIKPSVILMSSIVARECVPAPIGYAMAKSAVRTLNKYLSRMWATDGIRVNCVLPGNIYFDGGRWEEILKNNKEQTEQYIKDAVPMGRFGKLEEIADMIVFLSSQRSAFTTGAEIILDGGQVSAI